MPNTPGETTMTAKPDATKPSSLPFHPDVTRRPRKRSKLLQTPSEVETATSSLSDQYFIGLLWGVLLTRLWMHVWLVTLLLPIPVAIWLIKKLGKAITRG